MAVPNKKAYKIYILYINQLFDFYCNSTDWLLRDARSGCGDSRNRLQIVLHVFIIYVCIYMCLYVCVCKCRYMLYLYVYVCLCMYIYMCVCVCVYIYMCVCVHVFMYIYVHMYIYICMYVYNLICKLLLCSTFSGIFSVRFSLDDIYQF